MERPISDMASVVNEIFTFVRREAQGMEIGEVERRLLSLVMAVGRAALEEFVAAKGTGYAGKEIVESPGKPNARMSVTGAAHIDPFSERSLFEGPTITPTVHRECFLWTKISTCLREAIPTWFRSSLPGWRSR